MTMIMKNLLKKIKQVGICRLNLEGLTTHLVNVIGI